jgi:hypothetical protein
MVISGDSWRQLEICRDLHALIVVLVLQLLGVSLLLQLQLSRQLVCN